MLWGMAVDCDILLERAALNLLDPLQRNGLIYLWWYQIFGISEYLCLCFRAFQSQGDWFIIFYTFISLLRPSRVSFWTDGSYTTMEVLKVFVPEIHKGFHGWAFDCLIMIELSSLQLVPCILYISIPQLLSWWQIFRQISCLLNITWCIRVDQLTYKHPQSLDVVHVIGYLLVEFLLIYCNSQLLNCQINLGKIC